MAECLDSLVAQTYPRHAFEVIVVDNGSCDGSIEFVRERYPWDRLIEAGKNLGFAAGNNLGFARSRGDWIALLNNDASAEPGWLAASIAAGESDSRIGGIAAHLVFRDEPQLVNGTGLTLYRDGRGGDRDFRVSDPRRPRGEVFGGCGAGLVLRRLMLDAIGLFDPRLFMYYEDLDLAWRARQHGWSFVYEPTARVRHAFGGSAGASPLQVECVERNRAVVNLRHSPVMVAIASVLGAVARLGRAVYRRKNVMAHARAVAGIAGRALPVVLGRRGLGDALYRRWSQPLPR